MSKVKCACHLVLADGTKVAIKDSEARKLIEKKLNKIDYVVPSQIPESSGYLYGTYLSEDKEKFEEAAIVYGGRAIQGDIVQRVLDGNIILPDKSKIYGDNTAVSVSFLNEKFDSKIALQEFRNSITPESSTKVKSTSHNFQLKDNIPLYFDFGVTFGTSGSTYINIIRVPLGIAYNGNLLSGGYFTLFEGIITPSHNALSMSCKLCIQVMMDYETNTIHYKFSASEFTGCSSIRIEKFIEYFK